MEIWGSGALRWISCDSSLLFVPPGAKRPDLHVPMRKRTAKEEKKKGVESSVFCSGKCKSKKVDYGGMESS